MTGAAKIRSFAADDVEAVATLERDTFPDPWSAPTFRRLLGRDDTVVLVLDLPDGTLGGYAILLVVLDQAEVANLAVRPDLRGQGWGGRLLDALIDEAKCRGVIKVFLEVRESNVAARALYGARGFVTLGIRRDYYEAPREDALVMELDLSNLSSGESGT